jgi:hypothetical protein
MRIAEDQAPPCAAAFTTPSGQGEDDRVKHPANRLRGNSAEAAAALKEKFTC